MSRDLVLQTATMVDSARNANGVLVGQKVGEDVPKLDNLVWPHLTAEQWSDILQEMEDFTVTVEYPDMVHNRWATKKFYCGDRTAKVWKIDWETGLPSEYIECKCNLIGTGE
jgi:hypothetical protein